MGLTIILLPSLVAAVIFTLNFVAIYYDTVNAIPIGVMLKMVGIWVFAAVPLAVLGTTVGRHWVGKTEPPCRVNTIPRWVGTSLAVAPSPSPSPTLTPPRVRPLVFRPIPPSQWYSFPPFVVLASGVLPFGSIFIEMYFIFTSFWSYKFYYVYGFMLLVYGILVMVTICTTIVSVYFILNSENYHWHWVAFASGGSTALYVFLYSIYYFIFKTQMTGTLQTSFYFGYM